MPSAPAEAVIALMLWTSVRSTSVNAIVPLSVRLPAGVTSSVTAPVTSATATIGASLVPVMVTLTVRVTLPPWPSSSVKVKVSTLVWPAARYSTARGRDPVVPGHQPPRPVPVVSVLTLAVRRAQRAAPAA